MATFEGTAQEFHHYIGPKIRNAVNALTRKIRMKRNGICELCGKQATLESAHVHGKERRLIVEEILSNHTQDGIVYLCDLEKIEKEILAAHLPIEETFKFICKSCHNEYDQQLTAPIKHTSSPSAPQEMRYDGETVRIGNQEFQLERDMKAQHPSKTYFLNTIPKLIEVLPQEELALLLDQDFCRSKLAVNYPVITTDQSLVKDKYGRRRYYPQMVNNTYYVCNDWYDVKNRNNLANWRNYLIELSTKY